jgi:hypothetical protein
VTSAHDAVGNAELHRTETVVSSRTQTVWVRALRKALPPGRWSAALTLWQTESQGGVRHEHVSALIDQYFTLAVILGTTSNH